MDSRVEKEAPLWCVLQDNICNSFRNIIVVYIRDDLKQFDICFGDLHALVLFGWFELHN